MIDIGNQFFVGAQGDRVLILNPPRRPLTRTEALVLAAWLVTVSSAFVDAGADAVTFDDVLRAIQT